MQNILLWSILLIIVIIFSTFIHEVGHGLSNYIVGYSGLINQTGIQHN